MPSTVSPPPDEPRLLTTLGRDLRDVVVDVQRTGFRRTVRRGWKGLQDFYLTTHTQDRLAGMTPVRRWLFLTGWLLKSLFLKLTPTRRVLLLIAFVLLWQGSLQVNGQHVRVEIEVGVLGVALLLVILMLELKDKLLARSELEAGRAVQLALMPDKPPTLPGWDISLYTRSANDVGGDLVDYLPLDDGRLGVMLGDVAGKGLPAALLMAKLQATLRALVSNVQTLGFLGAELNRILNRDGLPNRFATLVYLEIRPSAGRLRLLNAGHMPPLVVSGAGVREMEKGSIALGMMPTATFVEQQADLAAAEVLVVYSDGITEAMNATGEFFGDDRLREVVSASRTATAAQMAARIVTAVDAFVGEAPVHDDMSLVILRRT